MDSPLTIKKSDLIDALESSSYEIGYFIDRETGDLHFVVIEDDLEFELALDEAAEEAPSEGEAIPPVPTRKSKMETFRDDPDRYLEIEGLPGRIEFGWMVDFTETQRRTIGEKLFSRLQRPKPFAGFKDLAVKLGVIEDWYKFRDSRLEEYAKNYAESLDLVVIEG